MNPGEAGTSWFRRGLGISTRLVLALVGLGLAQVGCVSVFFSEGEQWRVYVPMLFIAVLAVWLAVRGLPLRREKAPQSPSDEGPNL